MRYACAVLLLFCVAAPAYAATPAPQGGGTTSSVTVTGWRLECDPGKTALACHGLNSLQAQNGAPIIAFRVASTADGKTALTINTPLGISVRTPVTLSVAGATQSFPFLTCSQQGCFATGIINADLLAAMRAGNGALGVSYALLDAGLNERGITASLPLTGFSQVYDKLK